MRERGGRERVDAERERGGRERERELEGGRERFDAPIG